MDRKTKIWMYVDVSVGSLSKNLNLNLENKNLDVCWCQCAFTCRVYSWSTALSQWSAGTDCYGLRAAWQRTWRDPGGTSQCNTGTSVSSGVCCWFFNVPWRHVLFTGIDYRQTWYLKNRSSFYFLVANINILGSNWYMLLVFCTGSELNWFSSIDLHVHSGIHNQEHFHQSMAFGTIVKFCLVIKVVFWTFEAFAPYNLYCWLSRMILVHFHLASSFLHPFVVQSEHRILHLSFWSFFAT